MTEPRARLVLDASVAVAVVRRESTARGAEAALRHARDANATFLVPSLFWLEVINALSRGHRLPPKVVLEAIADLDALELETVELDRPVLLLALDAVVSHGLTAYDAAYLSVAQAADAQLLTADARLAAAAGERALLIVDGGPSHAVAETPAPYGGSWADWPGAAAYLVELRARAIRGRQNA